MKQPGLPSVNAGPSASQVREAREVFRSGSGMSSLPAARILYGPPQERARLPRIPPETRAPPNTPRSDGGSSGPPSPRPDAGQSGPSTPRLDSGASTPRFDSGASTPRSGPPSPRRESPRAPMFPDLSASNAGPSLAQPVSGGEPSGPRETSFPALPATSTNAGPPTLPRRSGAPVLLPDISSRFQSMARGESAVQSQLARDRVDYVHGVGSAALRGISEQGLQPIATRLSGFAEQAGMSVATEGDRRQVADAFHRTMATGERGNTLDAWVRSPTEPIATGISVMGRHRADEVAHYARMGESAFPAVLGMGSDVRLQRRDVGHPLTEGAVAPDQIHAVYVPSGQSAAANRELQPPLRGRARSFPDLFAQSSPSAATGGTEHKHGT